jgi:3-hydroxyacyl-CoA dehydrogenase
VGLDTTLSILRNWAADEPGNSSFAIPKSLEEKVAAGQLGRKSGQGFYKWAGNSIVE